MVEPPEPMICVSDERDRVSDLIIAIERTNLKIDDIIPPDALERLKELRHRLEQEKDQFVPADFACDDKPGIEALKAN